MMTRPEEMKTAVHASNGVMLTTDTNEIGHDSPLYWQRSISITLYTMLIASLPLFSIRNSTLAVSVPLLIMLAISAFVVLRSIVSSKLILSVDYFDLAMLGYFCVIVFSLAIKIVEGGQFAFLKTSVYFFMYLALKAMLESMSTEDICLFTRRGAVFGTFVFGIVAFGSLLITGKLGIINASMSYNSLTIELFESINQVFGGQQLETFSSRDVMRNAVSEAFAFYFIIALVFPIRDVALRSGVMVANAIYVLAMFSRRGFLAIVIALLSGTLLNGEGFRRGLLAIMVVAGIVVCAMPVQENSRLADFSGGDRMEQYAIALEHYHASPIFGDGYGTRLEDDNYVHNFILSNAMMMGTPGLTITLVIFSLVMYKFMTGIVGGTGFNVPCLLIIPILGMTVGSTVEGVFSINAWVVFALNSVFEGRYVNSQEY